MSKLKHDIYTLYVSHATLTATRDPCCTAYCVQLSPNKLLIASYNSICADERAPEKVLEETRKARAVRQQIWNERSALAEKIFFTATVLTEYQGIAKYDETGWKPAGFFKPPPGPDERDWAPYKASVQHEDLQPQVSAPSEGASSDVNTEDPAGVTSQKSDPQWTAVTEFRNR